MTSFLKIGALALLIVTTTAAMSAQKHKGANRLATTEHVMPGMVHPNYLAIEKAAKTAKTDPQQWETLATNAALLNEAGYLLVDDERSLGKEWDDAADALRRSTAAMLVQIDTGAADEARFEVIVSWRRPLYRQRSLAGSRFCAKAGFRFTVRSSGSTTRLKFSQGNHTWEFGKA